MTSFISYRNKTKQKTQHTTESLEDDQHGLAKDQGWTHVLVKGKQFLPIIRDPPWFSYRQDVLDTTVSKQTKNINKTSALPHNRG
jgi:hypothetical protein